LASWLHYVVMSTCYHINLPTMSYWFVFPIISIFLHILLWYRLIYTYFPVIFICLHIFISPFPFLNIGFLWLLAHIQILKCNFHFLRKMVPTLIDLRPPISRNELTKNVKPIKKKLWSLSSNCFLQNLQHIFPWMVTCEWKHTKV
jgi:hypothetical protein